MNESACIVRGSDAIWLAGIDDAHCFRTHGYHKAAHGIPTDACAILLSHTPEAYRHAAHCGFALMLSGHTHGGQICLPGGIPILTDSDAPRAYSRGPWRFRGRSRNPNRNDQRATGISMAKNAMTTPRSADDG